MNGREYYHSHKKQSIAGTKKWLYNTATEEQRVKHHNYLMRQEVVANRNYARDLERLLEII